MYDVQKGLSIKHVSDLVSKEIRGIFETKNPTKELIRKYRRSGNEWSEHDVYTYVRSELMARIIKIVEVKKEEVKKKR